MVNEITKVVSNRISLNGLRKFRLSKMVALQFAYEEVDA
jgi:hypothetical protein